MTKFGFKEITQSNWLEPDDASKAYVRLTPSGQPEPMTGNDWMRHILTPKLLATIPTELQALFEVARGALSYGYFFYPLYTLASEQLFRVTEAAVAHKCKALGAPKSTKTFAERISWLVKIGVNPNSDLSQWDAIRRLRNSASHPERQSILTPGNAIGLLERVAEKINSLFSGV